MTGAGTASAPGATTAVTAPTPAPSEPTPTSETPPPHPATQHLKASPAPKGRVSPYVTAGLRKSELIELLGAPTQETGDQLVYSKSAFTFRNDSLVGWKVDPASGIRVKLWPDALVDPKLTTFHVGSSKNEVIAVQGTPTLFSEDAFGYGASVVYFESNRVVGWKNDRSSPLRTSTR